MSENLRLLGKYSDAMADGDVFSINLLIESDDLIVSNWTVQGTHCQDGVGLTH